MRQLETISWVNVRTLMPDDDMIVLIRTKNDAEPVWFGYHDGLDDRWRNVDGMQCQHTVTHWAEMPAGPQITNS
jgi:hypothetical protein